MAETKTTELRAFHNKDGKLFRFGDSVIVTPSENDKPQYVARVDRIQATYDEGVKVKVTRYYHPEDTVGGRHTFYGKKELLRTYHFESIDAYTNIRKVNVHSLEDYINLKTVGQDDYFYRFKYDIDSGWLSPSVIQVFCKCQMPFNPDVLMLMCEACKERYHPACLNMTNDEAKQLDYFRCDDCLSLDLERPQERKVETLKQQLEEQARAAQEWVRARKEQVKTAELRQQAAEKARAAEQGERVAKERQQAAEKRLRAAQKRIKDLEEQVKESASMMKTLKAPPSPPQS